MNNQAVPESILKAILDGIDGVIYVADPESFELLHVNEAFKKNWGGDVIGKKCYRVLQDRDAPCPFCTNDKIFGEYLGRSYVWEFQNEITKNWYRCSDKAIQWLDGRLVRFELASDITEKKEAEGRLEESQARLQLALDAAHAGVWSWKVQEDVNVWDERMELLFGLDPGSFGGNYSAWVESVHPDDIRPAEEALQAALAGGSDYDVEYRVRGSDHGWRTIHAQATVTRDEQGRPLQMTGICRDVTELREAISELAENKVILERSNKELEQFAYVASHDLQEPLRMVASYTQLLAKRYEGQLDDKADKYIAYAVDGATRMQRLINDLLAFSRVGTRGEPLEVTDCGEVVVEVLQSLQASIEETGAEIVVGELPTVMADRTQLNQVFQNLIANAIKFHGDEAPRIEVNAERRGRTWEICVADNGIGIDPQFFDRIFVIFQRLHGRGEYSGSGIGLSIVKKIVARHGGRIRIESAPGEGSRFIFTMPTVSDTGTERENNG